MGTRASTQSKKSPSKENPNKEINDGPCDEGVSTQRETSMDVNRHNISSSVMNRRLRGKMKTMEKELDELSQELAKVRKEVKENKPPKTDDKDSLRRYPSMPFIDHDSDENKKSGHNDDMSTVNDYLSKDNNAIETPYTDVRCYSPEISQASGKVEMKPESPLTPITTTNINNAEGNDQQGTSEKKTISIDKPKSDDCKHDESNYESNNNRDKVDPIDSKESTNEPKIKRELKPVCSEPPKSARKNKHYIRPMSDIDWYGQGINPNTMYGQELKITRRYRPRSNTTTQSSEGGT